MPIKVYIDQGHNPQGFNTGAEGNGYFEQDITYEIGRRLYNLLLTNPEFTPRLSRPTPETILGTSNSTSIEIFKITVAQMLTVNVLLSALNVPSGATALTTPFTVNGIIDGDGTYNNTSSTIETFAVALPSIPAASVYSTSTGMVSVACTLAQERSASLSIVKFETVASLVNDRALTKVSGYVGFAGVKLVSVSV